MSDGWADLLKGEAPLPEAEHSQEYPASTPSSVGEDDVPRTPHPHTYTEDAALPALPSPIPDTPQHPASVEASSEPRFEAELAQIVRNYLLNGSNGLLERQARLYNQLRPVVRLCKNLQTHLEHANATAATTYNVLPAMAFVHEANTIMVEPLQGEPGKLVLRGTSLGKLLHDLTASFSHVLVAQRLPAALVDCLTKEDSATDSWLHFKELLQHSACLSPLSSLLSSSVNLLVHAQGSQENALVHFLNALQTKKPVPGALVPAILFIICSLFLPSPLPSVLSSHVASPFEPSGSHSRSKTDDLLRGYVAACSGCISSILGPDNTLPVEAGGGVLPTLLCAILTSVQQQTDTHGGANEAVTVAPGVDGRGALKRLQDINGDIVSIFGADTDTMFAFTEAYEELQLRHRIERYLSSIIAVAKDVRVEAAEETVLESPVAARLDEMTQMIFQVKPQEHTPGGCTMLYSRHAYVKETVAFLHYISTAPEERVHDAILRGVRLFDTILNSCTTYGTSAPVRHVIAHNTLTYIAHALEDSVGATVAKEIARKGKAHGLQCITELRHNVLTATNEGGSSLRDMVCEVLLSEEHEHEGDGEGSSEGEEEDHDSDSENESAPSAPMNSLASVRMFTKNIATAVATIASTTAAKLQDDAQRRVRELAGRGKTGGQLQPLAQLASAVSNAHELVVKAAAQLYEHGSPWFVDHAVAAVADGLLFDLCKGILDAAEQYRNPLSIRIPAHRDALRAGAVAVLSAATMLTATCRSIQCERRHVLLRHWKALQELTSILETPLQRHTCVVIGSELHAKLVKLAMLPSKDRNTFLQSLS